MKKVFLIILLFCLLIGGGYFIYYISNPLNDKNWNIIKLNTVTCGDYKDLYFIDLKSFIYIKKDGSIYDLKATSKENISCTLREKNTSINTSNKLKYYIIPISQNTINHHVIFDGITYYDYTNSVKNINDGGNGTIYESLIFDYLKSNTNIIKAIPIDTKYELRYYELKDDGIVYLRKYNHNITEKTLNLNSEEVFMKITNETIIDFAIDKLSGYKVYKTNKDFYIQYKNNNLQKINFLSKNYNNIIEIFSNNTSAKDAVYLLMKDGSRYKIIKK